MIATLSFLLPPSLGGAVSPVMLTEQTVLLGTGGRRAATHYAVGVVLTLAVIVVLLVFFGHAIELPTAPIPSASLDIALGGRSDRDRGSDPVRRRASPAWW